MQSIWKCGLEHCKVAKDIDIALLRSCRKDWWITMKNVQISQELFFLLVRYFLIGQEETEPEITKALEKKMDSLAYLDTLRDNISQAILNKELNFVSSCWVDEASRTVKVGITEMKEEYIQRLKEFENMGPALDIFQQDLPVDE